MYYELGRLYNVHSTKTKIKKEGIMTEAINDTEVNGKARKKERKKEKKKKRTFHDDLPISKVFC